MNARVGLSLFFVLGAISLGASSCARDAVDGSSSVGGAGQGGARDTSSAQSSSTGSSVGGSGSVDDGPAMHVACISTFGNALSTTHGRIDGILVAVVPPGSGKCNADSGHVHLQVKVKGAVYDVAVNTDVLLAEADTALPDGAWAEGWHPGMMLDYPQNLGLHTNSFAATNPSALAQKVESELAQANHVSIFATGYGPDGAHEVHRKGFGEDGAIVINPLSPKAHLMLFRFSTQTF